MKNSYCMTHIEDTKPFQVSVPIKEIPFPLYQETKEELTWVCERRTRGVHRGKIFVKTDHKTTLPECSYTEARSADMQRFRMRLMRFHSKEIKYVSQGKKEYMAGAPSSEVNKWQWQNACTHWKRDLITVPASEADHRSTGGCSYLQTDQSVVLWEMGWELFFKKCYKTLLTVCVQRGMNCQCSRTFCSKHPGREIRDLVQQCGVSALVQRDDKLKQLITTP